MLNIRNKILDIRYGVSWAATLPDNTTASMSRQEFDLRIGFFARILFKVKILLEIITFLSSCGTLSVANQHNSSLFGKRCSWVLTL